MRIPPYPCAYCGRTGLPHPLSYEAKCADCAATELEEFAASLRRGQRAAIALVVVIGITASVLLAIAARGGP